MSVDLGFLWVRSAFFVGKPEGIIGRKARKGCIGSFQPYDCAIIVNQSRKKASEPNGESCGQTAQAIGTLLLTTSGKGESGDTYAMKATLQASRESHRVSKEPIAKDIADGLIASVLLPPNPLTASLRAKISSFTVATTKFRSKCSAYDSWRPASGLAILARVLNVHYWTHLSYQPNVRCQ